MNSHFSMGSRFSFEVLNFLKWFGCKLGTTFNEDKNQNYAIVTTVCYFKVMKCRYIILYTCSHQANSRIAYTIIM